MEKQASASVLISMDEAKLIETDLTSLDYSNCDMQILYRIQKRLDAVVNKWYPFIMETSVGMPSPDRNDRQTRIVRKGTIVGIKSDIYCEGSSVSISVIIGSLEYSGCNVILECSSLRQAFDYMESMNLRVSRRCYIEKLENMKDIICSGRIPGGIRVRMASRIARCALSYIQKLYEVKRN